MTITTAGWGGGPITTWGWGGWGSVVPPVPPPPTIPSTDVGSWISQDPEWQRELLSSFDDEIIRRVYDDLASLLSLQQTVAKAREDKLVRDAFALAFQQWRKKVAEVARKILTQAITEDHNALLDWCVKTERQIERWVRAFVSEVREFGAAPENITAATRRKKSRVIAEAMAQLPEAEVAAAAKSTSTDNSPRAIAKRVAIGTATVLAVQVSVKLIWKILAALEV